MHQIVHQLKRRPLSPELDLCVAASAVEKVIGEYDSKGAESVHEERDPALIAISGKSAQIRDICVFRC